MFEEFNLSPGNLLNDIIENIQGYYLSIVALLPKLLLACFLFFIVLYVSKHIQKLLKGNVIKRINDPLLANFFASVAQIVGVVIACLIALKTLGLGDIAAGLFAGAGLSAFVIGFAFKDIAENFLAGVLLAFNRPFRVGDTVELNGSKGSVVELSLRSTHIKSFDGKDIYIPNANVIKNAVVNYTMDGFLRLEFLVGVDYNCDYQRTMNIIKGELKSVNGILQEPKSSKVFISNLNASTLELTVHFWINTFNPEVSGTKVKTEAIQKVLNALNVAEINLPGDIVELKNYNNESLSTS